MKLKHYEIICYLIILFLAYEYAILNKQIISPSLIKIFITTILHKEKFNFDPTPGYPISYFLGWSGFSIMLITNFYILRKRFGFLKNYGRLAGWLDFHIFCGLLGPILIIFHSNFKVDGLVAISFWSMVICSSSGIIGRYFYVQVLRKKEEIKKYVDTIEANISKKYQERLSTDQLMLLFSETKKIAGANNNLNNPLIIFIHSMIADIKLMMTSPGKNLGITPSDSDTLKLYGVEHRRILFLEPFNRLLGYWHSFHLPFAFFMYLVAIIHIVTALLFGVKH